MAFSPGLGLAKFIKYLGVIFRRNLDPDGLTRSLGAILFDGVRKKPNRDE